MSAGHGAARPEQPMPPRTGTFITLEGIDGCGKSTQIRLLRSALLRRGFPVGYVGKPGGVLREPGCTALGEGIRRILLHRRQQIDPWAEALLYAAARAQLAHEVVVPALAAGNVVLLDRYVDSSLAYQGHARGLGIDRILRLNLQATGGLLPDLTVVVVLDPETAAARHSGPVDRMEREGPAFQRLVAEGYRELAARFPERVREVDGAGPPRLVAGAIERIVLERVGVGGV